MSSRFLTYNCLQPWFCFTIWIQNFSQAVLFEAGSRLFWAFASDTSDTKFFLTNKWITADLNLLYLIEYIIGLRQLFVNPTNIAKVLYGPFTFSPVPISIKSKMQNGDQQMKYTRVTVIKVTNPLCRFILLANLVCFDLWNKPNCSISFLDFWSSIATCNFLDALKLISDNAPDLEIDENHWQQSYSICARHNGDRERKVQTKFGPILCLTSADITDEIFVWTHSK